MRKFECREGATFAVGKGNAEVLRFALLANSAHSMPLARVYLYPWIRSNL